ncbi:virulence factor lipase N-terminal [Marinobacter sp. es.048]|uniref:hypothetical protein n=1 Tax=Marinobacter sp. es.048 TaxID=1761795 RepID=UPI000B58955C|nr:hypothetical protein [Marinobacter sp. es.048]SNC75629.1 virulence factor lipase N-terminal [Marinobacter sp. es.048]
MFKKTLISLAVASSVGLTGCFDSGETGANANPTPSYIDKENELDQYLATFEGKVWPVFDPIAGLVPIPSDLNYGPNGDGTYTVPDSTPPVTTALNSLSGVSTIAPIDIRMSGSIDDNIAGPGEPGQNVFLIELDYASQSPLQALSATESPNPGVFTDFVVTKKTLFDPDLDKVTDFIRILPTSPLKPGKRYIVAILDEVTANGEPIVSSPSYTTIDSGDDSPEGYTLDPGVDSVRSLIDGLWEPVAAGTINGYRNVVGGDPITEGNIALSYSFTTSNDEQVLKYIANPKYWLGDQVLSAARLGITKKITGAARHFAYLNDPENNDGLSPADWDLNDDGIVDSTDFDVNQDGSLTPADFIIADRNGDSVVDATDFNIALAPGSSQGFGYVDLKAAVDGTPISVALDNSALEGCDSETYTVPVPNVGNVPVPDQSLCVGSIFSGALASEGITLPQPESAGSEGISISFQDQNVEDAEEVSAVLGSFAGGNVNVTQGSIALPYYLGVPGTNTASAADTIKNSSWKADSALAANLNNFLDGAGFDLTLPQGTGASEVVNSFYPFPEKNSDVEVPMLVMYPKLIDADQDGTPETPFNPQQQNGPEIPVVIYQHGITTDRSAALTFGSALAAKGIAVIAIDQPLHGVDGTVIATDDPVNEPTDSMTGWALLLLSNVESTNGLDAGTLTTSGLPGALVQSALANEPEAFLAAVESIVRPISDDLADGLTAQAPVLLRTVRLSGSTVAGLPPVYTQPGVNPEGATERHFGYGSDQCSVVTAMDFTPANYSSDDARPASGDLFINLENFINNRDLLRQGSVDLMTLRASIGDIAPGFDESNVYFVGHSLGTLNGGAFVGATNVSNREDLAIKAANLLTPVAGTVRMLENSPAFAPTILAGIKAGNPGLTQEVSSLQTFFNVLQATLDTVDPINFADELSANVLFSQIEGDQVVINDGADTLSGDFSDTVCGAEISVTLNGSVSPLSGSAPLAQVADASTLDANNTPADLSAFVRFQGGNHSTPVLPADTTQQAVFGQMVAQTLSLIQSGGTTASVVTNSPDTSGSVITD